MLARKKPKLNPKIVAKAQRVLEFAEHQAREVNDWVELQNALFGVGGKATELFTNETERTAFCRTKQYKQILALMDTLPTPAPKEFVELLSSANGAISVRLPRSVHAALLLEARAEGVSLNQLCLSKLVAQLKAVV